MSWLLGVSVPVISYAFLSFFFSRYPHLLHPRRSSLLRLFSQPNTFIVSTHRGGAAERRENTLEAFRYSVELHEKFFEGSEEKKMKYPLLLELDVHLTKDEEVVIYHDETTERCHEGEPKKIHQVTLSELITRPFRNPVPLPPQFHPPHSTLQWSPPFSSPSNGVTTLEQLFAAIPKHVFINIDLKDSSPILLEKVALLIERYNRQDTVIWGSARPSAAALCKNRLPTVATLASADSVALVYFGHLFGFLPFLSLRHVDIFEVPFITRTAVRNRLAWRAQLGEVKWWEKALYNSLCWLTRRKGMYEYLERRGIQTVFWVLNEEEEMREAIDNFRMKGLMTDYPQKLFQFVKDNEKKIEAIPRTKWEAVDEKEKEKEKVRLAQIVQPVGNGYHAIVSPSVGKEKQR